MFAMTFDHVAGAPRRVPRDHFVMGFHSCSAECQSLIHVVVRKYLVSQVVWKKGLPAIKGNLMVERIFQPEHKTAGRPELANSINGYAKRYNIELLRPPNLQLLDG